MKESIKTVLLFLGLILSLIFAPSCTKQETIHQSVCINGNCDATHIVVYKNQEILPNINGHYEIEWDGLNNPIPIGQYTYTMNDLINLHPPYNIAGYQLPKHWNTDSPVASSYVGSYSKYNYNPTQNFLLDDEMVGDTINIFIETIFNFEQGIQYHGHDAPVPGETLETQIKVIVI